MDKRNLLCYQVMTFFTLILMHHQSFSIYRLPPMHLLFATQNKNKVKEIQSLVGEKFLIQTLTDIGFEDDIEETGKTLQENALIKARIIFEKTGKNVFADDSGLEVDALKGAPGVHSARYAGNQKDDLKNIELLLENLDSFENKKARFKTVIALIINKKEFFFEGIVNGRIIHTLRGMNGFGYDPIFVPDGYSQTFAEMSLEEKNKISHRAKACHQLAKFLQDYSI